MVSQRYIQNADQKNSTEYLYLQTYNFRLPYHDLKQGAVCISMESVCKHIENSLFRDYA